ncbi:hypothetical protein ACFYXP_39695 [Streptomyces sp. NPDC002466]
MTTQHITVTTTTGETIQTVTTDPEVAREYEALPFEAAHIASVDVTVTAG